MLKSFKGKLIGKKLNRVSAILITKEKRYPESVLKHVESFGFGEIQVNTECDGVYWRFQNKPRFKHVFVQDDDCTAPIDEIFRSYDGIHITCGSTPHHIEYYSNSRIFLIGHGAFFPWKLVKALKKYTNHFGFDDHYRIEIDRIFTFLNYPQIRIPVPVSLLPTSFQSDRLSMRKEHAANLIALEEKLVKWKFGSDSNSLGQKYVTATTKNYHEKGYLAANPDVEQAVRSGQFQSGEHHFKLFGKHEERKLLVWNK
jgi:hypothetical protein